MSSRHYAAPALTPRPIDPLDLWRKSLRPSQSLLSHLDQCGYAGFLYLKHSGGTGSHPMDRGTAFHIFAERATYKLMEQAGVLDDATIERARAMALEQSEQTGEDHRAIFRDFLEQAGAGPARLDPDDARDLMQQVLLDHPELNVPVGQQEPLRAMAWNFATGHIIDARAVIAVETLLELELDGWTLRGKVDRAELHDGIAYVHDYKTSRLNLKGEREDEGKVIAAEEKYRESFQPPFYALLVAEGTVAHPSERHPQTFIDPNLYGERLTKGVTEVNTLEHYPRYRYEETGELVSRFATWNAAKLADFKEGLRYLLRKLEHGLTTDRWAATPSDHCGICPMESECPIKPRHRKQTPAPRTEAQARALSARIIRLERNLKDDRKALKVYVEHNGALSVEVDGEEHVYDIRKVEQQRNDRTVVGTRFYKRQAA